MKKIARKTRYCTIVITIRHHHHHYHHCHHHHHYHHHQSPSSSSSSITIIIITTIISHHHQSPSSVTIIIINHHHHQSSPLPSSSPSSPSQLSFTRFLSLSFSDHQVHQPRIKSVRICFTFQRVASVNASQSFLILSIKHWLKPLRALNQGKIHLLYIESILS